MSEDDLSHIRILIAEDQPINQFILKKILGHWKNSPTMVGDGEEAVEAVKQNSYDLVFLDIHMPIMGGYEAARQIQIIQPKLPLVAISAAVSPFSHDEAKEAGLRAFIGKPYQSHEILELIKELA
ncbi:MAG TPA: hypothetical protein DCX14_10265 [Flavobacteriales bacterium]|jgi:two-component system, sensor histidine kinase|nr:response regulator [Flavobacteriales bacterium]HAW20556.1 hypothetical protein [Flavobacteriales bacterium]